MEAKETAKKLFERLKFINRYSGDEKAVKMVVKEIVDLVRENNDKRYWEEIKKEIDKL